MTTAPALSLHPDRLLPADPETRAIARDLYASVKDLPIISPHGHTDPAWYAEDAPFPDPATLFIIPDHYIFRMLYSQGVSLEELGIPRIDGGWTETDTRTIWRRLPRTSTCCAARRAACGWPMPSTRSSASASG
jgi:glucuronate isomerase